jgi:hypothetical protein
MISRKTNSKPRVYRDLSFRQCCEIVLCECPDPYAKSYAHAGLTRSEMQIEGYIESQCLYILSNMEKWQGDTAREVRVNLKRIAERRYP